VPLVDHRALGFDRDPTREKDLQRSLPLVSCRDLAWTLRRISSVDRMNTSLLIRIASTLAALSLVVVASTAAAGQLPPPLSAGHQALSPGIQVLDLVSRETSAGGSAQLPRIELTLPKGWFNYEGWGMNDGGTLIVSFWDVNKVYPAGCHWASKSMIDPGPTVGGLARVLYTRPLRHASKPRRVTLAGFHGKYLRWSVPTNLNPAHCVQGYFESWTAKGWASDRYQQGGGQVDRLWILNVDGQRLVIDAAYLHATKKQRAELNRIVHSIKFLPVSRQMPHSAASSSGSAPVWATGINNRGQVIGALTSGQWSHQPFVWKKGSLKLLGSGRADAINQRGEVVTTQAGSQSVLWENGRAKRVGLDFVWGFNSRGQVLGAIARAGDPIRSHPALWTNGKIRSLPFEGDAGPQAMNDRGQIVGRVGEGDVGEWQNGNLTDLGAGYPTAINNRGEILGSGRKGEVTVWRHGIATDIGPGTPVAINREGHVIGVHIVDGQTHAFLWNGKTIIDLGTFGGMSYPMAISNSDQVVGCSTDSKGNQYAFLWRGGTLDRLPTPTGDEGLPIRAVAINENNQIVGDDCQCGPPSWLSGSPGGSSKFVVLWKVGPFGTKTRQLLPRPH
jgi:probable HAF family extracellular repeat protein